MSRLLLIDDDEDLRSSVGSALAALGHEVEVAATGREGLSAARATPYDVVLVDLGLPDLHGTEVIRRLRHEAETPVLVLTAAPDVADRVAALDAGADDFLNKPFAWPELTARLRALARRPDLRDEGDRIVAGDLLIRPRTRHLSRAGEEIHLTPIEWRILLTLARHPGALVSHARLVSAVWGRNAGYETRRALRTHVRSLRSKLGDAADRPRYLRTESRAGYRWVAAAAGPPAAPRDTPAAVPAVLRHDLDNVLSSLEVIAFLLGPGGEAHGVSQPARDDAAARLPDVAARLRGLVGALTTAPPAEQPDGPPEGQLAGRDPERVGGTAGPPSRGAALRIAR